MQSRETVNLASFYFVDIAVHPVYEKQSNNEVTLHFETNQLCVQVISTELSWVYPRDVWLYLCL